MYRLGQAYLASGEQTAQVEQILRRIAAAYGMRDARVVAFPTAVFIAFRDGAGERVTLSEGATQTLRLDQMADVYALGQEAQQGAVSPQDGLQRLGAMLSKETRFGSPGIILGHAVLSVGLAMVLMPTMLNVATAAIIGAVIGVAKWLNKDRAVLAVPAPVILAALASTLVFLAVKRGLPIDPFHALIPPLVTFLPGATLTLGMVELAYGDMVSGASRLMTGLVQLVLLAFGLAVGAALVGFHPNDLVESSALRASLPAAQWAGVLVFGLGVFLHFSAPRNSLGWLLVALLCAFAAQRLATAVFSGEISGFFGTLVATPLAYLIQFGFRGPPATVTFQPAFWLLVPGSLGLISVTTMLSDRSAGLAGLVTVLFALASTALGTLVGASLYKFLSEKFGWWRLQIGRVGSHLRRQGKR
jgi:uncharacterized membrane protein YjjP (DUF1212 family)